MRSKLAWARWPEEPLVAVEQPLPVVGLFAGPTERGCVLDTETTGLHADARIVGMLDDQLAAEGWSPETAEYWSELEKRAAKYLPHRFNGNPLPNSGNSGYNSPGGQTSQRGSPVAGSTRNSVSTGRQEVMRLSAERVQAMKDAGMWDDPQLRKSMIERYKAEDATRA